MKCYLVIEKIKFQRGRTKDGIDLNELVRGEWVITPTIIKEFNDIETARKYFVIFITRLQRIYVFHDAHMNISEFSEDRKECTMTRINRSGDRFDTMIYVSGRN